MTRFSKLLTIALPAVLAALLLLSAPAAAKVYIDVTAAGVRKVPVAVPYFIDKERPDGYSESGRALADLLGRGLAFHGFISIIPPEKYQGRQQTDWPALGADFAVLGQYRLDQDGVVIELRLIDVKEGRMILGRRYRGPWAKHRAMVLKFCDEIILQLTGERGVSLSMISFTSDETGDKEIYLADVLGDHVRQVTHHHSLAVSPRFSPDASKLAYTSYHHGNADLYVTQLPVSRTTRPISRRKGLNMSAAWSPDGKTIALTLSKDGNPDLYLMDNQGKIKSRLTANAGINVSPSWSPDGREIAFVSDRSGTPQIYVMNVRTKATRRLTYSGNYNTSPSWSPKNDLIAYSGSYQGAYHIFVIPSAGGPPTRLTRTWGDHESPSWAPDGQQIVFARHRKDEQNLCVIFKNGKGLRTLFNRDGRQSFPQWSPRLEM